MEAEAILKLLFAHKWKDQESVELFVLPQSVRGSSLWYKSKVSPSRNVGVGGSRRGRNITDLVPPMSQRTEGCPGPPCLQNSKMRGGDNSPHASSFHFTSILKQDWVNLLWLLPPPQSLSEEKLHPTNDFYCQKRQS